MNEQAVPESIKHLTLPQLQAIAEGKSAKMQAATTTLHNVIADDLPIHQKAQQYVAICAAQQNKPPFSFDTTELLTIISNMAAADRQAEAAQVRVLYYQYMNLLPEDPFEALLVDGQVTARYEASQKSS